MLGRMWRLGEGDEGCRKGRFDLMCVLLLVRQTRVHGRRVKMMWRGQRRR